MLDFRRFFRRFSLGLDSMGPSKPEKHSDGDQATPLKAIRAGSSGQARDS